MLLLETHLVMCIILYLIELAWNAILERSLHKVVEQ